MPPARELSFPDGLPARVVEVLSVIAAAGHEVALVGGCVRDRVLGLPETGDWDAATSAPPEAIAALFATATWENRFGTVTIGGSPEVEVTSYRAEAGYSDRRRPDEVRFGVSLADDLARRDFTVNAMAWTAIDLPSGRGRLVDPFGGERDLADRLLRTVGDPRERFTEDALRLIRAARFAGRFEMTIEAETEAAIEELAPAVATVSPERVRDELLRILRLDPRPSRAFGRLERLGLLRVILPELAALRGVPQSKAVAGDALDHTLAAVDAATIDARLAALLHDLGKATTLADGHFIGHESVGAELAARLLARLRVAGSEASRTVGAIRHHMYAYDDSWSDAAVRRFIRRTADIDRDLLFALRRADSAASGAGPAAEANQARLEARIAGELAEHADLLLHRRLAVDGHDLQRELGLEPGPQVGEVLDRLTEAVLDDPSLNEPATLLRLARER
ncbi:MAG TPA: CCA tRNA nucleotidyltransferase [Candidatus Binatia bacterium]|nr:CCA tRNA nucleotidyltransferase [Candidatus Binatia bacterium]